jgi:hypothetical protein
MSAQGFTYCWSDHKDAKVYVGIHLGRPDDGYVCSSKAMMKEYQNRPQDFTREILFSGPYEVCAKFEYALINGLLKQDKNTFYNRSNGKKILFDDEIKNKISEKAKGRKMPEGQLAKMMAGRVGKPGPRKGVKLSSETIQKISESKKGSVGPNKGRKFSDEVRLRMSAGQKNRAPFTAEHKANLAVAMQAVREKRKMEESSCPRK